MNARIAVNQPVHTNLDAGSAGTVFKRIDPVEIGFGLIHTHTNIVAYGLRLSTYLTSTLQLPTRPNTTFIPKIASANPSVITFATTIGQARNNKP